MPTSTPRLALLKKTDGEAVDVVTDLAENFDKIDAAISVTLCTSATHPASPWDGQMIFETDTDKLFIWTGSAWRKFADVGADTAWQTAGSVNSGWDDNTAVQSKRMNSLVYLRGVLDPDGGGGVAAGNYASICTLAAGHRPPSGKTYRFPVVTEVDGATPTLRARGVIYIADTGTVSLSVIESTSRAFVDGVSFPFD